MKRYWLIVFFLIFCADHALVAQVTNENTVEITSKDTARLNSKIKELISMDYLTLLNSIVSSNFDFDEIKTIIEDHLNGEGRKMFLGREVRIESDFMFHIFQEINSEKDKINIELLKDDDCYYFNLKEVKILKKQSFFNLYQIFILGKRKELDENYIDKSNQTLSKTHTITSSNKMTKSTTKIKDSSNKLNKIANHKKNNSNINIQNSVESSKKMYLHVIATSDSTLINQVIAVLNGLI